LSLDLKRLFVGFKQTLEPGETLSQRAIRGGAWMLALRVAERLLGLVRTVVLARMLTPDDFGVLGVALLAMSALETLSRTGFDVALIQKKDNIREYLDTAWTIQVIRGLLLAIVLLIAAPLVARFFDSPEAIVIVRAMAAVELLKGLANTGVIYFQRDLEFSKQFVYQFSSTFANLTVAIIAALLWRNVWALALGLVTGQVVRCTLSFLMHPYRPRLYVNWRKGREIFGFGKWVMATGIVVFCAVNGDDILLGKLLGTAALGLYQMAYLFANLATTEVTHVISRVALPVYSRLQDDPQRLRSAFLKTLQTTLFLSAPVSAGVLLLGPDFTRVFLGEKWTPMVIGLQILAVSGLIRAIAATGGPLFNAVSRPHLDFWMNLMRVGVMAVTVFPLTKYWGLAGTSLAVLLGILASIPIWWRSSLQIIGEGTPFLLRRFTDILLILLAMGIPVLVLKHLLTHIGLLEFVALALLAAAGGVGLFGLLWKYSHRGPVEMIREAILSVSTSDPSSA
jgi:lipopolysaccharide exporter